MKPVVFVHTNARQKVGALVSAYSLRRNARDPESFEVRILQQEEHSFFAAHEGCWFLRDGGRRRWWNDDLQSFTPLRFMAPEHMGYQGRAVVMDPDIFAVGDIGELLARDMEGKAIFCRYRAQGNGKASYLASSVMLLDCAQLTHWHCERDFGELFEFERDYTKWVQLVYEPRESIGLFEDEWNSFDVLNENTKLLHNTRRATQPWKTGLPVDYTVRRQDAGLASRLALRAGNLLRGTTTRGRYRTHPDPAQEQFFFGLLRECVDAGIVSEAELRDEIAKKHIRPDALELLRRTPALKAA